MLSTIRSRLVLLMLAAVLGGVATAGSGLFALAHTDSATEVELTDVSNGLRGLVLIESAGIEFKKQVQEWKNILLRGNNPEGFAKYKKQFAASADEVQAKLAKLQALLTATGGQTELAHAQRVEQLIKDHAEMREKYLAALASFDAQDPETGKKVDHLVKGVDRAATKQIEDLISEMEANELGDITRQTAALHADNQRSQGLLAAVICVVTVLVLGIATVVVRRIGKGLGAMESELVSIRSNLDLTRGLPTDGRDELARMSGTINDLLQEFRGILKQLSDDAGSVSATSHQLARSVGQLSESVETQSQSTESMAASVEEMAVSVNHVSDNADHAQRISSRSADLARNGGTVIERTIDDMVAMTATVQQSAATVQSLSERSREISSVVKVINELADQTNLLALNAAIEAARAGEQGRGFAVVADEVRKLAERTAAATHQIASVITAIESEANTATTVMDRAIGQVAANAESAREAGTAIADIREGANEVVNVSRDISAALNEQKLAGESIAQRVEAIASMSEENGAALSQVKSASDSLDKLSEAMHAVVARFRV